MVMMVAVVVVMEIAMMMVMVVVKMMVMVMVMEMVMVMSVKPQTFFTPPNNLMRNSCGPVFPSPGYHSSATLQSRR